MKYELTLNQDKDRLTVKERAEQTTDTQQLQYLIEFVEEFKNYMDFQHIADLLKFVLLPMLQDETKRAKFINALDAAREREQAEIDTRLQQDPEALLDSIPHSGLALLKNTLEDFQAMSEPEREAVIRQFYKTPDVLTMLNTKATNKLFDPAYQDQIQSGVDIRVSGKQQKQEIIVPMQVFLSTLDEDGLQLPNNLTAYDRMVYDGYCTAIMSNPQRVATANQIYAAFAGRTTKMSRTSSAIGHVTRSLRKLSDTWIELDFAAHARAKGITIDATNYGVRLLNFDYLKIESGGQKVWAYRSLDDPILYRYAAAVGQIVTVDRALLEIDTINNTQTANLIKTYLLRRIEGMKEKHNGINSNRIRYDSMLAVLGITAESKTEFARFRTTVKNILDFWKHCAFTKNGISHPHYIKGYTEYKEGRSFAGVEIMY